VSLKNVNLKPQLVCVHPRSTPYCLGIKQVFYVAERRAQSTFLSAEEHTEMFNAVHEQRTLDNVVRITEQCLDFLLDQLM